MKKLVVSSALIGFALSSFAQTNKATVKQYGQNQSASQIQTGSYLQSTIEQSGPYSSNVGSFAATVQNSRGAGGNAAAISQKDGSSSNRAAVTQSGGTGNSARIQQDNGSGNAGNQLAVTGATSENAVRKAGGNWADILQQGNGNTGAFISQSNSSLSNSAQISQIGNRNQETSIDQSSLSSNNVASIQQGTQSVDVSDGLATIQQKDRSYNNQAFIKQLSSNNEASIEQNQYAQSNKATIDQFNGSGSSARIVQNVGTYGNNAAITQQGFLHTALIDQSVNSAGSKAVIAQEGLANRAYIYQNGIEPRSNSATVQQNGYSNFGQIKQFNTVGSTATIRQDLVSTGGQENLAEITQRDSRSEATITQNYSANVARLIQTSASSKVNITQTGDFNVVQDVTGEDGSAAIQFGFGNQLTISQNSGGRAPYVPNVAQVSQTGAGNTISITQIGAN